MTPALIEVIERTLSAPDAIPRSTYLQRLEICAGCKSFNKTLEGQDAEGICGLCNCVIPAKAAYKHSYCPDSPCKWGAV